MDRESVHDIIKDVFGPNTEAKDVGEWVSICCPLSEYTHPHGRDNHPSAGISVDPDGTSIFNCFTCKNTGPIHAMLRKYADYTGEDLSDLIDELEEESYLGPRTLQTWDSLKAKNEAVIQMPIDEGIFMSLYDSAAGHPYLKQRGISDATARKLELLFDPRDPADDEPRILFPIRGIDGLLYGFSGRAIYGDAFLKVRDYHGFKKAQNVLGAHLIARDNPDKVLLVEGLFDYASMHECGYYGAAVMHSTLTQAQADIFRELGKPTYLFYDNPKIDKAGREGVEIAGKMLRDYVPTMRVRYPELEIEDDSEDGYHMVKDPGDLIREDVEVMIEDARLY
jgi:hypothetical protein